MEKEITNNEIFDVLVRFANDTDARFDAVDVRLDKLEGRMGRAEALMVTKDYLDDKLANLEGRTVQMVDRKIALAC